MNIWTSLFHDYTFQTVALGSALLGAISGVTGSFAVLRGQSLLGDGVSHSALPGIVISFLLFKSKNTEVLLLGALASGLVAVLLIAGIVRYTRIKFDSALALVMSVFFGLGLVLLTYTQRLPHASQAGLKRFLFGQASALMRRDLVFMAVCGAAILLLTTIFWKEFKLLLFDPDFARSLGFSVRKLDLLLSAMIVLSMIAGLQTAGVILMSAMLTAPAAAARQWTNTLGPMVLISAVFGALSGAAGTIASSLAEKIPTGPAIVIFASLIVTASILFAPRRGMLYRFFLSQRNKRFLRVGGGGPNVPAV